MDIISIRLGQGTTLRLMMMCFSFVFYGTAKLASLPGEMTNGVGSRDDGRLDLF